MTPGGDEFPPNVGMTMFKKAMLAGLAIVLMSGAAVSAAVLLQVDDVIHIVESTGRKSIKVAEITPSEAGQPETIMVLGTDKRAGGIDKSRPALSDTIILVRLDPEKRATAIMSIPRDLRIDHPLWSSYPDKINAAYANGGPRMTLRTVKQLLSTPERPFKVNHIVTVDFHAFRTLIDYVGGVYVDIDNRYFNDKGGGCATCFATIDIQPGYQRLRGSDALDYVRYRHTDNDLVRAARQQDFLRQLKGQDNVKELTNPTPGNFKKLAKLFARYFDFDEALHHKGPLLSLFKLGIFTAKKPIQEVKFGIDLTRDDPSYLFTTPNLLKKTTDQFLNARGSAEPRNQNKQSKADKLFAKKSKKKHKASSVPGLEIALKEGQDQAVLAATHHMKGLPIYFPRLRATGSRYTLLEPRTYRIRDYAGKLHKAYRMVLFRGTFGEYYGVQGMTWRKPPILDNPDGTKMVDGRKLLLYRDGQRLRLVAWRTPKAVYWVANDLQQSLKNAQIIGIAASLTRLK